MMSKKSKMLLEAVAAIAIICLIAMPTVPAIRISAPAGDPQGVVTEGEEIKRTQTPEYQDPPPEPDFDILIGGEPQYATFWQVLSEFPVFDDFGRLPFYSLLIPAGIYRLENPNDINSPMVLYGCQIWAFLRASLFSGHTTRIEGTLTYNMHSGGEYDQDVYIYAEWGQWQPLIFPIRVYRVICYESFPIQCLESIDCDLNFYEDGRFIWHYGHTIPMFW